MAFITADRVMEVSATVGNGPFALAGAVDTSYLRFGTRMAVGDVCHYLAYGADSLGKPTGEWEIGRGTYSAADTLSRTTVVASSAGGAAVMFSAGPKYVSIAAIAPSTNQLKTDWRAMLGLNLVDNTPDSQKPVSTPQQNAIIAAVGPLRGQAMFVNNGSWTCPAGVTKAWLSGSAGGGGGGAGAGCDTTGVSVGSGGGGGGAGLAWYRQELNTTPGTVYTIAIGAGGAAGQGVVANHGGNGGNGGNSTVTYVNSAGVTVTLSLWGGSGGLGGSSGGNNVGGGRFGNGYPNGDYGRPATKTVASAWGGMGGSNQHGMGGIGGASTITGLANPGLPGEGYGAGGGGGSGIWAVPSSNQAGGNGGAGRAGFFLFEW